jgi:N-acetylneuraminic acid mutarotase
MACTLTLALPGTELWQQHEAADAPCARQGHGLVLIGKLLYLFGGMANQHSFDDLWCYDTGRADKGLHGRADVTCVTDSHTWRQELMATDTKPCARSGHVLAAVGTKLLLFGGLSFGPPQPTALADVWIYDPGGEDCIIISVIDMLTPFDSS